MRCASTLEQGHLSASILSGAPAARGSRRWRSAAAVLARCRRRASAVLGAAAGKQNPARWACLSAEMTDVAAQPGPTQQAVAARLQRLQLSRPLYAAETASVGRALDVVYEPSTSFGLRAISVAKTGVVVGCGQHTSKASPQSFGAGRTRAVK